ncbi:hypothetical protein BO94DRAFT_507818 [Aspergillus sclerotioniger CBS 115572]|uniref:Zn(2)-C6 fungal-type domain-containing protein n=1 Tax=Aspergillus sclerotioniger CBS 115572 TaxID=1450535 RepID=A0A317X8P4_9EURO|nr:hypothetical protein BO94DRAFT_507818 [Aspergillus sclerotioniger CBS 115572]PWY94983.1 hypothetical protein BO94DRAFT_507818 [Aspergillus sclerotioniger CBS 115572]
MNAARIQKLPHKQTSSTARLSCVGCTKRKVKCDRLIPCTNCRTAGVLCVPVERRRLPRGRSRRPETVSSQVPMGHDGTIVSSQLPRGSWFPESTSSDSMSMTSPSGGMFNHSIQASHPTTGLDGTRRRMAWDQTNSPGWVIDPCPQFIPNEALFHWTGAASYRERQQLLQIYLSQVDPIVKIIHGPSLRAHLLEGKCYLNYGPWHPAPAALASAVYYAASCTLSPETCLSSFGTDKASLISKYQNESRYALERVDYVLTEDLTVLQAFVISLIAMRCHDRTRRFWTMLALALRIAQALSLHDPNPPFPMKAFEREMRRRLWHAIGWLDIQASLSSASEPMMQTSWLRFQPFLDLNDDEFSADLEIQVSTGRKISETSLFHVLSYAQETTRYLTIPNSTRSTNARRQQTLTFKKRTDELLVGIQPDKNNFHWYLKELAHSIEVFLQLLAVRPPQKNPVFEPCPVTNVRTLRLAVEALDSRRRVYSSAKTQQWRWIHPLFFPWQALAVALAEVQVCDDIRLVESIWPLIEQTYLSFNTLDIESPTGRLRQLMHDMMERARMSYNRMLLVSLGDESGGSILSWGLLSSMLQPGTGHQADESWIQVADVGNETWVDRDLIDLGSLGPGFHDTNSAGFGVDDPCALPASDSVVLLQ